MTPTSSIPEEQATKREWRALAFSILGVFAIVGGLNAAMGPFLSRYGPNTGSGVVAYKWRMLEEIEQIDWLVLGDSTCNQGVDPKVITEELGGTSFNACTIAAWLFLDSPWMLEVYMDRHPPPKNVILIHAHHSWHRQLQINLLADVPLPWGYWRELTPSLTLRRDQLLDVWASRFLPLYADNLSMGEIIRRPWKLWGGPELDERGLMHVTKSDPELVRKNIEFRKEFFRKGPFPIDPLNRAALLRVAELSTKYGFRLFIVNAPLAREIGEDPEFPKYFPTIERFYTGLAKYPNIYYVPDQYLFEPDEMDTADHVVGDATQRYSHAITKGIQRALASPF